MTDVSAIMQTQIVTAHPGDLVADVVDHMVRRDVGSAMVISDGKLVGVFSERDLLRRVVHPGLDPATTPIGDVATTEMKAVEEGIGVVECARVLAWQHVRHLPVLEGGAAVGLVSMRDVLSAVVDEVSDDESG